MMSGQCLESKINLFISVELRTGLGAAARHDKRPVTHSDCTRASVQKESPQPAGCVRAPAGSWPQAVCTPAPIVHQFGSSGAHLLTRRLRSALRGSLFRLITNIV